MRYDRDDHEHFNEREQAADDPHVVFLPWLQFGTVSKTVLRLKCHFF
jgi:hypothetical protein